MINAKNGNINESYERIPTPDMLKTNSKFPPSKKFQNPVNIVQE